MEVLEQVPNNAREQVLVPLFLQIKRLPKLSTNCGGLAIGENLRREEPFQGGSDSDCDFERSMDMSQPLQYGSQGNSAATPLLCMDLVRFGISSSIFAPMAVSAQIKLMHGLWALKFLKARAFSAARRLFSASNSRSRCSCLHVREVNESKLYFLKNKQSL